MHARVCVCVFVSFYQVHKLLKLTGTIAFTL